MHDECLVRVTVGEAAESEARVTVDLTVRVTCGKGEYLKSVGTVAYDCKG